MKNKVFALLMAGVMAASMTACGGSSDTDSNSNADAVSDDSDTAAEADNNDAEEPSSDTGASEDENKLTVWTWDPNFNIYAIQTAADLYAKDHPGFSVEVTENSSGDIETKLTTAVSAGDLSTLPDIFLMQDNSFQKYVKFYPGVFTDITDSGIDFSQFSSAKVAYSTVDGKHYGVPFDNGADVFCVRTDVIEQAGYAVDDFTDITWSDFIEKGKKVKETTGLPLLTAQAGMPDLVMQMIQSCGASCFDEDGKANLNNNEAVKKAVGTYKELVETGVLQEVVDGDQVISALNTGSGAGIIRGCWILASVQQAEDQSGKWALTNMPKLDGIDGATNYSNDGGASWVISSNCKNVELAEDFLASTFAGSKELYETILPSSGALSTWLPAAESEVYDEPSEYFGGQKIFSDIVDFASKTPSNITGPYYYDARDALGDAISNITQSGMGVDDALDSAQETVEFTMSSN